MQRNIDNLTWFVSGGAQLPGEDQIPLAPVLHANQTAAGAMVIALYVGAALAVGWAGWKLIRDRDALPLVLVVSGVIAANTEPLGDLVGSIVYAVDIPWFDFWIMGRQMPSFILVGLMPYVAVGGYIAYRYIAEGRSLRDIFMLSAVYMGIPEIVMEILWHHWGIIGYYGENPTLIFGIPLYTMVQNSTLLPVYGIVIYFAVQYLRGPRILWLILFIPATTMGYVVGVSWPIYMAVQSSAPAWLSWIAGLVVCVTSIAVTYALLQIPALRKLREDADSSDGRGYALIAAE